MRYGRSSVAGLLLLFSALASAAPTDEIKSLVEQGKTREAYEFGSQRPELLGEPTFDYFFGVAAVDSGHAGEGVLALERYLLQFPANTIARTELARAYFVLGEDTRAREEFQNVLKENPPSDVQATIERYMDAIRTREARYRTSSSFYLEAGLGIDSNVNGGVSAANINLPVLGNVTVANNGVRKGDNFTHLGIGGQASKPIVPGIAVFGAFGAEAKLHSSEHAYDLLNTAVTGGLSYLKERNLFRLSASQSDLTVENDHFRSTTGLSGEWNHQRDELQSFQTSLTAASLGYTGFNEVRDANYTGLGFGYRRALVSTRWEPVINFAANYATERNKRDRPDLGRDIGGIRAGLGLSPHPKWGINIGLGWQESRYNGPDAILLATRRDHYTVLDASVIYLYSRNLSIRGEVLIADNRSNVLLYEYTRNMLALKVRYEFK